MTENKQISQSRFQWRYFAWFGLGAACFLISQPLLRLPLLGLWAQTSSYTLFSVVYPTAFFILLSFSAGLFEEGFRFLFKKFLLRPAQCPMIQPVLFGLGHGTAEAVMVLLPLILSGYSLGDLWLGVVERTLAIVLHIALTILVWNGFQTGWRIRFLLAAIAVHGLVNSVVSLLVTGGLATVQAELVFGVMVLVMALYAFHSRKLYIGGNRDEKTDNEI